MHFSIVQDDVYAKNVTIGDLLLKVIYLVVVHVVGNESDAVDHMASVHIIVSSVILCLNIFHSVLRCFFIRSYFVLFMW